jgi:RNA polymerase sigma factor (sigma-70 family)
LHYLRHAAPPAGGLSDGELLRRWVTCRDEAAFEALAWRHGPMVLAVCRRLLPAADVDDAFQATFLTLVRKGSHVGRHEAVAGWLYRVAYRVALAARADAARRAAPGWMGETAAPAAGPSEEASRREASAAVLAEVGRLPARYRDAVVLCHLEGQTLREAARELSCPKGTVSTRLTKARALLRVRLARRGLAPATLAALALAGGRAPAALVKTAAALARWKPGDGPSVGSVSQRVAALFDAVTRGTQVRRMAVGVAMLLALGVGVVGFAYQSPASDATAEPPGRTAQETGAKRNRRDPFGDPLPPEALARLGTIRFRHGGYIEGLAFGRDGRSLITTASDGLRVWDAATGELRRWFDPKNAALAVAITSDQTWIAVSPDGKFAATTGSTQEDGVGAICLRDLEAGRVVRRFGGQGYAAACYNATGDRLAAVRVGETALEIWNPKTGKKEATRPLDVKFGGFFHTFTFTPDAGTLVTSDSDMVIRAVEVATGKVIREIAKCPNEIQHSAVSPDGALIATVGCTVRETSDKASDTKSYAVEQDDFACVWDVRTGKQVRRLSPLFAKVPLRRPDSDQLPSGVSFLTFTPEGKRIVTGGYHTPFRVWDTATGKELKSFPARDDEHPYYAVVSPDGRTLAYGAGFQTVRLLDLSDGGDVIGASGAPTAIWSTAVSPDGRFVAAANWSRNSEAGIRVWDRVNGREHRRLTGSAANRCLSWSAGGQGLLSLGFDDTVRVWDVATGRLSRSLKVAGEPDPLPALSADGKFVAAETDTGMRVTDVATGRLVRSLNGIAGNVRNKLFAADDSRTLFAVSFDGTVYKWELDNRKPVARFPVGDGKKGDKDKGFPILKDCRGRLLVLQEGENSIVLRETTAGSVVRRIAAPSGGYLEGVGSDFPPFLALSPDGRTLAWAGSLARPGVLLFEVASGRQRHQFTGHLNDVFSLSFTPDGQALVSGGSDTTALIWDLTGQLDPACRWGKPLSRAEMEACWKELEGGDAAKAYRAIRTLAGNPAAAIYIREHLRPAGAADAQEAEKNPAGEWSDSPARLRAVRAVEAMELAGTAEARRTLEALAGGRPAAWLTRDARASLDRLARRPAVP